MGKLTSKNGRFAFPKIKTMKRIILIMLIIAHAALSYSQNQASAFWQETIVKRFLGQEYLNLQCDISFLTIINGVTVDSNTLDPIFISSSPSSVYQRTGNCISLLTADSLFMYFFQEGSFTYGRYIDPKTEFEINTINRLLGGWFRDLDAIVPFYINPRQNELFDLPFSSIEQVDDKKFKLTFSMRSPWSWTDETGLITQCSEQIYLWVDSHEMLVTRAQRIINNSTASLSWSNVTDISISNISFERPKLSDAFFREYITLKDKYDVYNINQGQTNPSEAALYVSSEDESKLLDAPLINILRDTITIRQINGWILVDIWEFGCKPCAKFHNQLSKEQDSLGYRVLEYDGVNILCLNPLSLLTESFVNYSSRFGITDIAYSAKSILGSLNWYSYPYYILISPDKKIVYRGNDIGENYQTIINAITSHEKK